jgi:hypothetical protein
VPPPSRLTPEEMKARRRHRLNRQITQVERRLRQLRAIRERLEAQP